MKGVYHLLLGAIAGGVVWSAVPAMAAPGLVAPPAAGGFAPAARTMPQRPAWRPGQGFHRRAAVYGAGYGWSGAQQTVIVLPEMREPPAPKEPAIPVAIGIARPPVADPVLYRIETLRGRPVVRVMRFGSDGRVARQ